MFLFLSFFTKSLEFLPFKNSWFEFISGQGCSATILKIHHLNKAYYINPGILVRICSLGKVLVWNIKPLYFIDALAEGNIRRDPMSSTSVTSLYMYFFFFLLFRRTFSLFLLPFLSISSLLFISTLPRTTSLESEAFRRLGLYTYIAFTWSLWRLIVWMISYSILSPG